MQEKNYESRMVTVPNILTVIRALLIPLFWYLYRVQANYIRTAIVVAVCGLIDVLDGLIARKYKMESRLGAILDPAVDALAELAMCLMLLKQFSVMKGAFIFLLAKEIILMCLGIVCMRRTGAVNGAHWYGKASAIVHYAAILPMILDPGMSRYSSNLLAGLMLGAHAAALIGYLWFYIHALKDPDHVPGAAMRSADWQVMGMYLLLVFCIFLLLFTSGETVLKDALPKPLYLFVRFASIVGILGIPAFFWGEKLPREKFNPDRFPFRSFKWEDGGRIYEKIGIQWWKNHTPDMSKHFSKSFPKQGNLMRDPNHLRKLVAETCSAEFVHWVLILFSPLFVILMDDWGIFAMILYILGNLVSLIIQRYNRPRIQLIIKRIEERENASTADHIV